MFTWSRRKHMYLIRGSVGAQALFLPIRRRKKKKGHARRSKKTHPNTYLIRENQPYGPMQEKKPDAYSNGAYSAEKSKYKTKESQNDSTQHTQDARRKEEKALPDMSEIGVGLRDKKMRISAGALERTRRRGYASVHAAAPGVALRTHPPRTLLQQPG